MKRLFLALSTLVLISLLVGCSSESAVDTPKEATTYPSVQGLEKDTQHVDDSAGLRGAVKVWFEPQPLEITSKTCGVEQSAYTMSVTVNTQAVDGGGWMRLNLDLRTHRRDNPTWYYAEHEVTEETSVTFEFTVTARVDMDLFMDLNVLGAKDNQRFTGRHFDSYMAGGNGPAINAEMCSLDK